jgi:hypothetical protein
VAERRGLGDPRHFFDQQTRFATGEAAQKDRAFFKLFLGGWKRIGFEKQRHGVAPKQAPACGMPVRVIMISPRSG